MFALAAGLIFALHPLHSEAVAYLWGRSSSLCGTFYFASLLTVIISCRQKTALPRLLWGTGAFAAGFLAWKTKEEAIALPLLVAGYLFLRNHRRAAAGVLAAPLMVVALRYHEIARLFSAVGENRSLALAGASPVLEPGAYFLTHVTEIIFYYFAKFVFPVGLNADLVIKSATTIADVRFLLAFLCIAGLALVCLRFIRSAPMISFGLAALLISPLAAYSFMPLADVVAEHRAYIAGLGFALVLASAIIWIPRYSRTALLMLTLMFGITTVLRNRVWADSMSLWRDAEKKSPGLARPHLNLGIAYLDAGMPEDALTEFEHALSVNPRLAPAYVNRGAVFFRRGELDRAEAELKKAVEIAPERAAPYLNLASIALARNQPEAAMPWLDRSLALEDTALCRFTRGEALLQLGREAEAAHEYQRAADLSSALPELSDRIEGRMNQLRRRGLIRQPGPTR